MSAAILQGAPGTTLDLDVWINLPSRQYMRVVNLCRHLGAEIVSNTVAEIGSCLVNFLYEVHGLKSFASEYKHAVWIDWDGCRLAVLPLARVIASKEFVGREKDLAQLPLLKRTLRLGKHLRHG